VESNDSLPPGMTLKKSLVGWLPVHRDWDQLRAQRSVTSMGKLYLFTFLGLEGASHALEIDATMLLYRP